MYSGLKEQRMADARLQEIENVIHQRGMSTEAILMDAALPSSDAGKTKATAPMTQIVCQV